ncbi:MAG: tetratricopeptide repeat protein [Planctomycetes bacterium]|nr:tetratricopeptide repeat protein [Planctomycetota bacterium]
MALNPQRQRERRLQAAQGYLTLDMPGHALAELDAIVDPHEAELAVNSLRGEALRQKSEWSAALECFQRAIAETPENVSFLLAIAWCYKRTGQLPRAIEAMERAYQIEPQEAIVLYNLSCYFALAGDKANALSWLGRAIRMDSSLRELIPDESDFDGIRYDPDFQFVTKSTK